MNIGLVLSGGMAKGAYQVGALTAIKEIIPDGNIKYISASSVGALNSYAYAIFRQVMIKILYYQYKKTAKIFAVF